MLNDRDGEGGSGGLLIAVAGIAGKASGPDIPRRKISGPFFTIPIV